MERFGRGGRRGPQTWCGMTARVWLMVAALTMGLAVLMASAAMAVIALSVSGVSAGLWLIGYGCPTDGRHRDRARCVPTRQRPRRWTAHVDALSVPARERRRTRGRLLPHPPLGVDLAPGGPAETPVRMARAYAQLLTHATSP